MDKVYSLRGAGVQGGVEGGEVTWRGRGIEKKHGGEEGWRRNMEGKRDGEETWRGRGMEKKHGGEEDEEGTWGGKGWRRYMDRKG